MTYDRSFPFAAFVLLSLAACDAADPVSNANVEPSAPASAPTPEPELEPRPLEGTLEWALAGDWRPDADKARDADEKLDELVAFFEIEPDSAVLEIWPGGGWHAAVLAPYLKANGGAYRVAPPPAPDDAEEMIEIDAGFDARFADPDVFGDLSAPTFDAVSGPLADENSIDVVLTVSDIHGWMALGIAEKAFADAYAALKPGGVFAVIEAAARGEGFQDPSAASGYVQTAHVKLLATEAGFAFASASPVLENAADDADHPFGVWTLPPYLRTSPIGQAADPSFDAAPFAAIGAPNRMALKFIKPTGE